MAETIKGRQAEGEKFRMKSKTNTIQYYNTEQAVQHMLAAGVDKQIMAQNMMASHEIDRSGVDREGVQLNDYRQERIDVVNQGRRADETIRAEMQNRREQRETQVKIDTQKKMLELEEFAIWRERHLREELKIENPKASDLRRFSITTWRKNKEGGITKRLSTKEKLEAEIREWRELELNNVD